MACLLATVLHATSSTLGATTAGVLAALSLLTLGAVKRRRDFHPLQCSLVNALHQIAAIGGGPEVRTCLPELEALAETGWQQTRPGAPALTDTLKTVKSLPDLSTHPLPAAEDRSHTAGLPLAADAGSVRADDLPMPSNDGSIRS